MRVDIMRNDTRIGVLTAAVIISLFVPLAARAQGDDEETKGVEAGSYNIQQSIEAGYREDWLNGNQDTYDTFVNLDSGLRLFDYSLDMRSLDHNGFLFDNLDFTNFGYGGDPNDVSRLRIEKNKWYNFSLLFRRDKNFWDYNLLANPFNPAVSTPAIAIPTSPHALDLVRRMQDYNLTLFPQSRVRIRAGYSHDRDEGPGSFTTDGGTIAIFNQQYSYTTDAYHVGADFRVLPKTTISYDQFLTYFKQNNVITDNPAGSGFVLANGTPVDPGIIWSSSGPVEILPCAAPIATAPNVVNPTCNAYLGYSQINAPHNFMPTERLQFQSNYFNRFETSGSLGYSNADNFVTPSEVVNDLVSRTGARGSTAGGPASAKRVTVDGDWSGTYAVTDKFRILDMFRYDNWRIPGYWGFDETSIFGQMQPGVTGLLQPQALFTAANFYSICPAPYTEASCPAHTTSSAADVTDGSTYTFLGQNIRSNNFELQYDFTPHLSGRVGYVYTSRTIADFSASFDSAEVYFAGGAKATAANDFLAARGACAKPAACTETVDPTSGQIISLTFAGAAAGNDTSRNVIGISENAALVGFTARPMSDLRITADFEFGYNDYAFTRISPRQMQSYKVDARYNPRSWINIDGAIDIHENRDNISSINDLEHGRHYSFVTTLMPNSIVFFNLGYTYTDIYSQAQICYYNNSSGPVPTNACPASLGYAPPAVSALGFYSSNQNFAYGNINWKPAKRLTATVGFSGSFVSGSTTEINALQVPGTLAFNYLTPTLGIRYDVYRGLSYLTTWNYYGYDEKGQASDRIPGLAPIPTADFNGSTATFAFRYAF